MDLLEFNTKYPLKLKKEIKDNDKDLDTKEKIKLNKKTKVEINPKLDGDVI